MGMVCGKPVKDKEESSNGRNLVKKTTEFQVGRSVYSKREDDYRVQKKINSGEIKFQVVERKGNGLRRVRDDYYVKNKENFEVAVNSHHHPGAGIVPMAIVGEQVAAGWPSWLASAAGEAVDGWLPRKADTFEKLDKIGQGTYSSVYRARDLTSNQMVAIKRVRFDSTDIESVKFMAREILILRRLDHPNVIKLNGLITSKTSTTLYLVFDYMDHDLTGLASLPGSKFTEPQVKCYMKQLLSGLDHCHSRGVLHRDIKGSNLLIDDKGILKIADFGLASFFYLDQNIPMTSRVVTLWYRPPELLLGATHYGTGVDLWSTGCILGELYTGKPIMPGRTEVEQLHKIFKLCGSPSDDYWRQAKLLHTTVFRPQQPYVRRLADVYKYLPVAAVGLMDTLLSIDPAHRITAASALKSQFFSMEPFACDPSSLPKYPPSKEIDAKLRDEEAKRKGVLGNSQRIERELWGSKDSHAVPLSETQRGKGQPSSMAQNKLFNLPKDDSSSSFRFDTPESSQVIKETRNGISGPLPRRIAYSGPLGPGAVWTVPEKKHEEFTFFPSGTDSSNHSGLLVSKAVPSEEDSQCKPKPRTRNQKEKTSPLSDSLSGQTTYKQRIETMATSRYMDTGNFNAKARMTNERVSTGRQINFSGPILAPSSKVEQMLKEHERQIQEAGRRARIEKTRLSRFHGQQLQVNPNPLYEVTSNAR